MTESENIDSTENIVVTNDAAFERVTSDIKMEEGKDGGYLQQNTAGLVQEIPNISFLDLSDTLLENKKTYFNRQNFNVIVGTSGKSIEIIPQDFMNLSADNVSGITTATTLTLTENQRSYNTTTMDVSGGSVVINTAGVYEISYGWVGRLGVEEISTLTGLPALSVAVQQNSTSIVYDLFSVGALPTSTITVLGSGVSDYWITNKGKIESIFSGGKTRKVALGVGDVISLRVTPVNATAEIINIYLDIKFIQPSY